MPSSSFAPSWIHCSRTAIFSFGNGVPASSGGMRDVPFALTRSSKRLSSGLPGAIGSSLLPALAEALVARQVQLALVLLGVVAGEAVFLEDRERRH